MITVSDLRVSYDGLEVLHGINASFPEGKISAVIGPNGCGKSTTLHSLVRMIPQMSGNIKLDGKDLGGLSPQELARRIAYLPQSRSVPDITVERLVLHGRFPYLSFPRRYRKEDWDIVDRALKAVGLSDLRERKMENLSGGQRQKAYFAMVLAQDTDVILMEEPTTFLDIKNQFELLDRARLLADSGKTVIMILHDFESMLRYADNVVLISDGSVLKCGCAEDVLSSNELRQAFGVTPCFYETEDGTHCYVKN